MKFPVLVLVVTVSRRVAGMQSWVRQPEYAEVNPGESVVLQCVINNKQLSFVEGKWALRAMRPRAHNTLPNLMSI